MLTLANKGDLQFRTLKNHSYRKLLIGFGISPVIALGVGLICYEVGQYIKMTDNVAHNMAYAYVVLHLTIFICTTVGIFTWYAVRYINKTKVAILRILNILRKEDDLGLTQLHYDALKYFLKQKQFKVFLESLITKKYKDDNGETNCVLLSLSHDYQINRKKLINIKSEQAITNVILKTFYKPEIYGIFYELLNKYREAREDTAAVLKLDPSLKDLLSGKTEI